MKQEGIVKNEKPQVKGRDSARGRVNCQYTNKDNTFEARHKQGVELYLSNGVTIGENGYFKVLGFAVDTEHCTCECPDFQKYQRPCVHYYAVREFQKYGKPQTPSNTQIEARGEAFSPARVRVRLAALSLSVEILKTFNRPITSKNLFKVAGELEAWATGVNHGER